VPNLRELIAPGAAPLVLPGAANALTARIIADLGFPALYLSGAGITNSELGLPDLGFITLDQLSAHVARVRDVVDTAIVVDCDTGFGNALNVAHTVRVLERSGASALQIEDQVFPKRCGHFDGKEVAPVGEMVSKVKAAVDVRASDDLLIIARTDALAVSGFNEAVERAHAYQEAGADIIFIEALESHSEIAEAPRQVSGPLLINMVEGGRTPMMELDELSTLGYGIVLYANSAMRAAITSMQLVLKSLLETGSTASVIDHIAPWSERQRLVDKPYYDEMERRYA